MVFVAGMAVAFLGCSSTNHAAEGTISVGMTRAETLQRLRLNGAVEVAKDVLPDGKGWAVAGGDDCLFLSFTNDVLTSIEVETHADKPKMYRGGYVTKIYRLR